MSRPLIRLRLSLSRTSQQGAVQSTTSANAPSSTAHCSYSHRSLPATPLLNLDGGELATEQKKDIGEHVITVKTEADQLHEEQMDEEMSIDRAADTSQLRKKNDEVACIDAEMEKQMKDACLALASRAAEKKYAQLEKELEIVKKKLDDESSQRAFTLINVEQMGSELKKVREDTAQEKRRLEGKLATSEKAIDEAREKIRTLSAKHSTAVGGLTSEILRLKSDEAAWGAEIEERGKQLEKANSEIERLRDENEKSASREAEKSDRFSRLTSEYTQLQAEVLQLKTELNAKNSEFMEVRKEAAEEIKTLRTQLQSTCSTIGAEAQAAYHHYQRITTAWENAKSFDAGAGGPSTTAFVTPSPSGSAEKINNAALKGLEDSLSGPAKELQAMEQFCRELALGGANDFSLPAYLTRSQANNMRAPTVKRQRKD